MLNLVAWLLVDVVGVGVRLLVELMIELVVGLSQVIGIPLHLPGVLVMAGLIGVIAGLVGIGAGLAGISALTGYSPWSLLGLGTIAVAIPTFIIAIASALGRPAVPTADPEGHVVGFSDLDIA